MSRETDPLRVARVVGDVLDPFTKSVAMTVRYNTGEVTNGREFKPSQVTNQPNVEIGGHDLRTFYTLGKRRCATRVLGRAQGSTASSSCSSGSWVAGRLYAPMWRQNFNTREFAELYNLGSPVAAVYRVIGTGSG
ncbi:hypothetical protein B296_00052021 [Ensete ventricosum]|uniref:Uncharacterized protein n=1 Tax=Ensete ventricosum TaxID=4639 RepID=A0A426WZ39_ENSVE|nr:hypothetical protein B296_00052021 [Ensete ventricosum]